MPTITLPSTQMPDSVTNRRFLDGVYLLHVMCSPDDLSATSRKFDELGAALIIRQRLRPPGATLAMDAEMAEDLLAAGAALARINDTISKGTVGGQIVGMMCGWILSRAAAGAKDATLKGAKHMAGEAHRHSGRRGDSPATLQRLWGRYRPVAHLWAAERLLWMLGDHAHRWATHGERLDELCALAEVIRREGEEYSPPHAEGSLLDPAASLSPAVDLREWVVDCEWRDPKMWDLRHWRPGQPPKVQLH